jgi:hypothetical protein
MNSALRAERSGVHGGFEGDGHELGAPKIEGKDMVAGKEVPAPYFGATKVNNSFDVVDEVVKENGGTATFFVKDGEDFVRVSTNVKKDDGSRAIGTILDPKGAVIGEIKGGHGVLRRGHYPWQALCHGLRTYQGSVG